MESKTSNQQGQWKSLNGKQKIQYVWDYYKFPIIIFFVIICAISCFIYSCLTEKEKLLYAALVNVSISEEYTGHLSDDFVDHMKEDSSKKEVPLYTKLYLTDDKSDQNYQYAYASRVKVLASIDDEALDVVLMSKQAYDIFVENGYLCNLKELIQDYDTLKEFEPYLVDSDHPMGLNLSQKGYFKQIGYEHTAYVGIITTSPRIDTAAEYIKYLYSED